MSPSRSTMGTAAPPAPTPEYHLPTGGTWPEGEELYVYYKRVVDLLWNEDERSHRRVIWNEWAEEMAIGMLGNQY